MSESIPQSSEIRTKRPLILTLLCILSFFANGLMVIVGLTGIFSSGYIADLMEKYSPGYQDFGFELLLVMSFLVLLIFGLKLWGVMLMFFGRKGGYILYLIPAGMLMIMNIVLVFATYNPAFIAYLLISIIFIVLYGIYLKHMN
jgi:hypothetical protein